MFWVKTSETPLLAPELSIPSHFPCKVHRALQTGPNSPSVFTTLIRGWSGTIPVVMKREGKTSESSSSLAWFFSVPFFAWKLLSGLFSVPYKGESEISLKYLSRDPREWVRSSGYTLSPLLMSKHLTIYPIFQSQDWGNLLHPLLSLSFTYEQDHEKLELSTWTKQSTIFWPCPPTWRSWLSFWPLHTWLKTAQVHCIHHLHINTLLILFCRISSKVASDQYMHHFK